MNRSIRLTIPLIYGFALTLILVAVARQAGAAYLAANGDVPGQEAPLKADGLAYEVRRDSTGKLIVSDFGTGFTGGGEIWQIDPSTSVYTLYQNLDGPSDGRRDEAGNLWWADVLGDYLALLPAGSAEMSRWDVPDVVGLFGTQIDASDRFWVIDAYGAKLHSLDASQNELCSYNLPDDAAGDYLAAQADTIWFGDNENDRIARLDPAGPTYTYWQLDTAGFPEGVAFDDLGNFWWADSANGTLNRLQPGTDKVTTYEVPTSGSPEMIYAAGQNIWYSEDSNGSAGLMRPGQFPGTTTILSRTNQTITPSCSIQAPTTQTVSISTGVMAWETTTYTVDSAVSGFTQYGLPSELLWGVAAGPTGSYVVDYDRQKLIQLPALPVDVAACKLFDEDGDLATTDDQMPVEGHQITLMANGVAQDSKLTVADGCVTWSSLPTGISYGVQEQVSDDWKPLKPISQTFEVAVSGALYQNVFVNTQADYEIYLPLLTK